MPHCHLQSLRHRLTQFALVLAIGLFAPGLQAQLSENTPGFSLFSQNETASAQPGEALVRHEIRLAPQLSSTIDLTTPADNLWDRIRNGFGMSNLNDSLVLYYQQWYQNRPDALRRMVERSRPYLHYIVEELEARGMPTEIALLPMVESSFNPMAYSRAHASGLWQFIPATGKRFKLEQDWWRDERRNVIASTNAALDYLQTIYEMHGDWQLALASYNWGEGAVKKAVEKNELRGRPTDYPSLNMPNETRHYVPKLQALKNIFGDPAMLTRLGIPAIPNEAYFVTLEAPEPIDIKTAARLANMSLEEFQRLNPSHNRPVIRPESGVVLPADKAELFRNNLENHQAPLSNWQAYTVTATERLDQIAARFETTAAELARANGLGERVRLAPGSTLLVPGTAGAPGLANIINTPSPLQIVARDTTTASCPKKSAKRNACGQESAPASSGSKASPTASKGKTQASGKPEKIKSGGKASSSSKPRTATATAKPAPATKKTGSGKHR